MNQENNGYEIINFGQEDIINYAQSERNSEYFNKLATTYGLNRVKNKGYCFGLSNLYLLYSLNNQGDGYINQINYLLSIVTESGEAESELSKARIDALKLHAESLLNKYLLDITYVQKVNINITKFIMYEKNMFYRENEKLEKLKVNYTKRNGENFIDYVKKIIDFNIDTDFSKQFSGNYSNGSDHFDYIKYFCELQKQKLKKYTDALFNNDSFMSTPEGKKIESDPIFIEIKKCFKDRVLTLNSEFDQNDAEAILKLINNDIYSDFHENKKAYFKSRGARLNHYGEKHVDKYRKINLDGLEGFLNKIYEHTLVSKEPLFYKVSSSNHSMAIVVQYNSNNNVWSFKFFEPNQGVITFYNKDYFFEYIDSYFIDNDSDYKFYKGGSGEIHLYIEELKDNKVIENRFILEDLNERNIKITENKFLAERKVVVSIDNLNRYHITYIDFSPTSNIVKVEVTINGKSFYVYSDILESEDLISRLFYNKKYLSERKKDVFISQDDYKIYSVGKKFNIENFNSITEANREKKFGKPIARLGIGFDNIEIGENRLQTTGTFSGEHSEKSQQLDFWLNPMAEYELTKFRRSQEPRVITPSEYSYNVIIQLEGENAITIGTANAFSKYPDDSMVIQYDVATRQYKILHGNIEDLKTHKAHKVRWATIAHGIYSGNNKPTTYAGLNAEQYVSGVRHLQENILGCKAPDKLVLIGCKLARGEVNENFALKVSKLFGEQGKHFPISAYDTTITNVLYGAKYATPEHYSRVPNSVISDAQRAKNHKFIYHYDPSTRQVWINKEPAYLYLINQVRRGEITLSQLDSIAGYDPMIAFRDPTTHELDFDTLRVITDNPQAYKLFISELQKYNGILPDNFQQLFSNKLIINKMDFVPPWRMVDASRIKEYSTFSSIQNDGPITVIIRMTGDAKGVIAAEKMAAKNPENTLIIQMNISTERGVAEYGIDKITAMSESGKPVKWVIIGDINTAKNVDYKLGLGLNYIKQKFSLAVPEHILFHSIMPASIENYGDDRQFTTDLSENLKQYNIVAPIELNYSTGEIAAPKSEIAEGFSFPGTFGQTTRQKVQSFLEKIALKEIDIDSVMLDEHPYLKNYFMDENGNLDTKRIKITIYDPIVGPKINQYLNSDRPENKAQWDILFQATPADNMQTHAWDNQKILLAINQDPQIIHYLSDESIIRLKALFPDYNGFDSGKVLSITSDPNAYFLMNEKLSTFSGLNQDNFVGDSAPFKGLSFLQAFNKHDENLQLRHTQFYQLVNNVNQHPTGSSVNLINHGMLWQNGLSQQAEHRLGLIFALEANSFGANSARDLFERKLELEQLKAKGILTQGEKQLLNKINQYIDDLGIDIKNYSVTLSDQSILNSLSFEPNTPHTILFLKGEKSTFTINCTVRAGIYEYSLFDPHGIQLTVVNRDPHLAESAFTKMVKNYLNEEISLLNGNKIKRGQYAGFKTGGMNDFITDIQRVDIHSADLLDKLEKYTQMRSEIADHIDFSASKNSWVNFNGELISLSRLQNLGATVNGELITLSHTKQVGWHKNARFNAEKLASELMLMDGNNPDLALIKLLRRQMEYMDIPHIIDADANVTESAVAKRQLEYVRRHTDADNITFSANDVKNLRDLGTKLPRFQRIASRFGQGMGGAGAIQSLISVFTINNRLENPDLTEKEIAELEKQRSILYASAFFNYGDMATQPILSKVAFARNGSSLSKARLASGVMIVFNLGGMVIDLYQMCDNFSKVNSVTNPKQRQDLIVNGLFSTASLLVNGVTLIGIVAGVQCVPAVGALIGGLLLIGGWTYNGYRAVENIKSEIDIEWDRELEEGIRGALGLDPTQRTQQEIINKRFVDASQKHDWVNEAEYFENTLIKQGIDQHLAVIDRPIYENETRYYLVGNADHYKGDYFGGKYESTKNGFLYSHHGAPLYSLEDAKYILENYDLEPNGTAKKSDKKIQHPKFIMLKSDLTVPRKMGSQPSHERYSFNPEYRDPSLTAFMRRHKIRGNELGVPTEKQLEGSSPNSLKLRTKAVTFYRYSDGTLSGQFHDSFEHIENDKMKISHYLDNPHSGGISFNTGVGNDLVIGKKNKKNSFQIYEGEKYFVGGNKNDSFYLKDSYSNLSAVSGDTPSKYLDGGEGNDSLFISHVPKHSSVNADLNGGTVNYLKNDKLAHRVADIKNIENVFCFNAGNDRIDGNDKNNTLYSDVGKDIIYGHGGNDRLIFSNGYANGGDGNDTYYVKRYVWSDTVTDLYKMERTFNGKNKTLEERLVISDDYKNMTKEFKASVIIDEIDKSTSDVYLDYSLKEIKNVTVWGKDLYIDIQLPAEGIGDPTHSIINTRVTIILKNVYTSDGPGRNLNHNYQMITHDGFILRSQLQNYVYEPESVIDGKLFNLMYSQENDNQLYDENSTIVINEKHSSIEINQSRFNYSPTWGTLLPNGNIRNLTYIGNDKNNLLTNIHSGTRVKVSHGFDNYQINNPENNDGDIVFDFSDVKDNYYTDENRMTILLPTENGYQLKMEGARLVSKNKFGEVKFSIRFEHFYENKNVYIQDKNNNLFMVELGSTDCNIVPFFSLSITDSDDSIILPKGYPSDGKVINTGKGNDIIINNSGENTLLLGDDGNDIITANGGHNVLYGGQGNNFISSGDGDDLILSIGGHDILKGGKGNDHYIIDGDQPGDVIIDDIEGENHYHLINFNQQPEIESNKENDAVFLVLTSKNSTSTKKVKIRQPKINGSMKLNFHHYSSLNGEFDSITTNGMEKLVEYIGNDLHQAKRNGLEKAWRPTDVLKGILNGLSKPLISKSIFITDIELSADSSRENWLVDASLRKSIIKDDSGHGRVFKGGMGSATFTASHGENVLVGGSVDNYLRGGDDDDVLISLFSHGSLIGGKGNDLYIVNGYSNYGDITIDATEGKDKIVLINFSGNDNTIKDIRNDDGTGELTYESTYGRKVIINYDIGFSKEKQIQVLSHLETTNGWKEDEEQTVDRLIQLLAEQRVEHEMSYDLRLNHDDLHNKWGAVQIAERFLASNL